MGYEESYDILISTIDTLNRLNVNDGFHFVVEKSRGIKVSVMIMDGDKEELLDTVAYGTDPDEVFSEFFGAARMLLAINNKFELTRKDA